MLKNTALYISSYAISIVFALAFAYETLEGYSTAIPLFYYHIRTTRKGSTRMDEFQKALMHTQWSHLVLQRPDNALQDNSEGSEIVTTIATSNTEKAIPGGLQRVWYMECQGTHTKGCRGKQVIKKLPAGSMGKLHDAEIQAAMLGWQHMGGYWMCPHCTKIYREQE